MTAAYATWHGRRGTVVLGPTEHRVASWLRDRTAFGLVTFPTSELIAALGLERSEAYRITARLRVLGLFGIANDRSGSNGGRRWWRTSIAHDGAELDDGRHRTAWARIVAAARARRDRLAARLAELRARPSRLVAGERLPGDELLAIAGREVAAGDRLAPPGLAPPTGPGGESFRDLFLRHGGPGAAEVLEAIGR